MGEVRRFDYQGIEYRIDKFIRVYSTVVFTCWEEMTMMSVNQIREVAERKPFQPVRFVMASGKTYDVTHPENIRVLQRVTSVVVGENEEAYFATLDNLLISEILPLNTATTGK